MAVAALLHPKFCHVQGFMPEPLCPKQVAVALKHAHHVIITDLLQASRGVAEQQPGRPERLG